MSDAFDKDLPIPDRWERNYSTNYEGVVSSFVYGVVNEFRNPVLQVFYTAPNEVHVNGIFRVDNESEYVSFGGSPSLLTFTNRDGVLTDSNGKAKVSLDAGSFSDTLIINSNDSRAVIGELVTNEFYKPIFPGQRAIFKYPSDKFKGVFADWITGTNNASANDAKSR